MVTIMIRLFIKNNQDTESATVRQAYGMLCGAVGIFFNLLLCTGKAAAGLISGSVAITADALNNLSDAASSLITLLGFHMAGQKPDPEHPFGHGRIEYISGLAVSFLILLMAFELVKTSIDKILHPQDLAFSPLVILILLFSILVKCYMALYNRNIGRWIHSSAMHATALDSLSDCVATLVVLISTLVCHFTGIHLDGWCGLLVGLLIGYAGYKAGVDTISPLLGQAPDPEFVDRIQTIVLSYDNVIGVHDLIVHNYGPGRVFVSLHAEVPSDGNILDLHDTIDLIEHRLRESLHCNAVIHMDPVLVGDPETERLKAIVTDILSDIDPQISMHDFRIVQGPTHTNLIFDVVIPFQFSLSDTQLSVIIDCRVKEISPNYFTVIDVDKRMS